MIIDTAIIQATLLKDGISKDKYKYEILTTLIDTAKKYQKIQEIIADWRSDGGAFEMSELYWLKLISEVVEDGND